VSVPDGICTLRQTTIRVEFDVKSQRAEAFRRLLAQKPWIVPIPGTTKLRRLEENIGAAGVELTSDDLGGDSVVSKVTVQGARYPQHLQRLVGR
jgi:aryl-alcohol dehydrogenase-like predicted oxidoreductase